MTDADPSEPSDPGDILHVLSEAHSVGGHTRLAWRWMRAHRGVRHSVALTTSRGRVPDALIEAVRASGGTIHRLAESGSSLLDVARKLRALALSAGLVVLHIHPYDATAVLALSNRTRGPKTIFVNHADHVFWVGVGAADVVANVRPVGESLCVERRGIEPSRMALLPVPIDAPDRKLDRAEAKRELGLAHDAPLFLTVANAYKLEPLDGLGYLDLLPTIMARVPRAELVVVGADENERWKNASGRAGGRIRAVGFREDLQRFQAAADVYVDSYPVSSLTSFLESARFGMPVVRAQLGPRETNIFDVDDHFLDPHVLVGRSVDELVAILNALVDDPSACVRRGEMSARAIIDGHGPEAWSRQLELVIARAAEVGPAEIAPIWRRPNIDALDEHILMLHAGTDMSQSLETLRIFHR
jgi:glycosyltransferase involved in cell wall biosynthesis